MTNTDGMKGDLLCSTSEDYQAYKNPPIQKCKLSVLSASPGKNVLKNMLLCFGNFHCYHLAKPGAGIQHLLTYLRDTVNNYTLDDYFILLIGKSDFKAKQYEESILLEEMRETLAATSHTNVIVCPPVYIRGNPVYNSRIKEFNKNLHVQLHSLPHVQFYDTNGDVTPHMASRVTKKPSSMKTIFVNLKSMLFNPIEASQPFCGGIDESI